MSLEALDQSEFPRLKQRGVDARKLNQTLRVSGEQMEPETLLGAQELQECNQKLQEANDELTLL
jgi:hypothetical protein